MARLSFGQKLILILWKNWHVELYHWRHVILCICTPFLIALQVMLLRCLIKTERVDVTKYEPIDLNLEWHNLLSSLEKRRNKVHQLQYNCFMPRIAIAYAPNTSDYVNLIMKKADTEYLDEITLISYATTSELQAAMVSEHYLVGVKFDVIKKTKKVIDEVVEEKKEKSIYPQSLSFSLLFPSELRIWDHFGKYGSNWRTYELFDSRSEKKHRYPHKKDGGYVGYVREGFANVQNAISMAFISLRAPDIDLPPIKLQRFPRMAGTNDKLIETFRLNVSIVLILGFLYPCMFVTLSFNREKENDVMTFLHVMGISYTVQMVAWYINSFVVLLISSLFFVAALKIHWADGYAILNNSSGLAVLGLLIAYILASISFTFMVSSFFTRRSTATFMLVLLWIFTYVPALIPAINDSPTLRPITCIFSNCCMFIAFDQILKYESFGQGFLWSTFFDSQTIDTQLTNGVLALLLLLLSFMYTIIGLCIFHWRAGLLEIPKKIRNTACFQSLKRFSKSDDDNSFSSPAIRSKRMSKIFEVTPNFKTTHVEIKDLKKTFRNTIAVQDFNLSLFSSEIMVIMGRNGAGKSTLLSMLTGMLKPTKGTVIIKGIDIRKQPENAFENVGFCLQENILIPELNVFNQLSFHCRMKGLTDALLEAEIEKYLLALNMQENRDQNSGELSIGLKRYLSVCCALCAESNFVVLDEPDTGMDLLVRKNFRDLLKLEKHGRTILMTTHSTEEADCLADRIAIMSGGELKCHGTSIFLRRIYSNGYRLVCVKGEHCDSSAVTAAIQKFLPIRLVPESELGTELSYRLDQKYLSVFSSIIDYLEQNFLKLDIISVSIGEASIDDVLLSMGTDNPFGGDRARLTDIFNGVSSRLQDEKNLTFLKKTKNYKGFQLLMSQWQALLLKRFLLNFRVRPIVIVQLLVPIILTAVTFPIAYKQDIRPVLTPMTFRLNQYPESITVLDIREDNPDGLEQLIIYHYMETVHSMGVGHKLIETGDLLFTEFILDYENLRQSNIYSKHLIAATFTKTELRAWFNNYPLHTVPLTLNMMHNAVLKAATNDSRALIVVTHEPLPHMLSHYGDWHTDASVGNIMAINLTFCIGLVWSTSIMSLVKERQNNFKLIQYIHGARPSSYWQTVFFFDSGLIITVSISIMIVILCFQHNVFLMFELQTFYFLALIVFGILIFPFNYVISLLFEDHITAFCVVTLLSIYGGVTVSTFMIFMERTYARTLVFAYFIKWLLRIVPYFGLCNTLAKLFSSGKSKMVCSDEMFKAFAVNLDKCDWKPFCCKQNWIWSWSDGLFPEIIALVIVSICSTIALVIIELRSVNKAGLFGTAIHEDNENDAKEDFKDWHDEYGSIDESRESERIRVLMLKPKEYFEKALIMKCVGKIQKRGEEFHRIFLIVNQYECFGLFGSSVSGKTAFMKMLIQNNASTYGQIYVNGLSLRKHLYKVYDQISYCQQISCNLDAFSGYELMKIFCMLHGIPRSEIAPICEGLARAFGFMTHLKKLIEVYSPGIKRRFRTSLAMLGNPSIIYLDEPMLGIDLPSLRQLCHVICQVCKSGSSVLFTSLNYSMTEVICSRIAFLANGRLSHIGSPYKLNELHFRSYLVKLKLKKIRFEHSDTEFTSGSSLFLPNPFLKIQTFVETTFPNAVMKDQRGNVMYFLIPSKNMKISHIFDVLHRNSFILDIENFLVSHDTLSLFINDAIERSRKP